MKIEFSKNESESVDLVIKLSAEEAAVINFALAVASKSPEITPVVRNRVRKIGAEMLYRTVSLVPIEDLNGIASVLAKLLSNVVKEFTPDENRNR